MPTTSSRPDFSTAVPVSGGYRAMSINDYARVDSARSEFLNFLLAPGAVFSRADVAVEQAA